MSRRLALVPTILLVMCAAAGCPAKKAEVAGVGSWVFGRTTLKDAEGGGRCLPPSDGSVQCIMHTSVNIGAQPAQTFLYFPSAEKNAPLLEISLVIRACQLEDATKALETQLGKPAEVANEGKIRYWTLKHMFVSARLPAPGGVECEINFVDPKDTKRIEDLRAGK